MPDTLAPGADLAPIDKAAHQGPSRPPDLHGTAHGLAYAAYWHTPAMGDRYLHVYYIDRETGQRIDGHRPRHHRPGYRTVPSHLMHDPGLIEHRAKQIRERLDEDPTEYNTIDEGSRTLDIEREKEVERRRVARALGKAPEQVKPYEIRAMRESPHTESMASRSD